MDLGSLFFSFYGRINRCQMFMAVVIQVAVLLIAAFLITLMVQTGGRSGAAPSGILAFGLMVAFIVSGSALRVKRLHDLGITGWLQLLAVILSFIPLIGTIVMICLFFVDFVFPGQEAENRYGPPPQKGFSWGFTGDDGRMSGTSTASAEAAIAEAVARRNGTGGPAVLKPKAARPAPASGGQAVTAFGRRSGARAASGQVAFGKRG